VWLHGDLHPANILVDDGQVSGVIDFGDIAAPAAGPAMRCGRGPKAGP
jgi:Ser/Thr protein kinase RdoA (MazF antagonist)